MSKMKQFQYGLLAAIVLLCVGAVGYYTIDDLANNAAPGAGTIIEIYDPTATPRSGKLTLNSAAFRTAIGLTYPTLTNLLLFPGVAAQFIDGNSDWRVLTLADISDFDEDGITNALGMNLVGLFDAKLSLSGGTVAGDLEVTGTFTTGTHETDSLVVTDLAETNKLAGIGYGKTLVVATKAMATNTLEMDLDAELALKAPLASPALTGDPTAPTPAENDNDTSIATTAYVQTEIAGLSGSLPSLTGVFHGGYLMNDGTNAVWLDPRQYFVAFDDFLNGWAADGQGPISLKSTTANSGAAAAGNGEQGHPGILQTYTGAANGVAQWEGSSAAIVFGGGYWRLEWLVKTPAALATDTDYYELRTGFTDNFTTTNITDGVFFRYATNTTASPYTTWQLVTRSNNSETVIDSTVAVAASTWYKLTIVVEADASSATGYINDGTAITGVNGATIPTGATRYTGICSGMICTSYTTSRTYLLDYVAVYHKLTTAR